MGQKSAFLFSFFLVLFAPLMLIFSLDFFACFVGLDWMFTQYCIDLVTEMLLAILSICSQEELNESDGGE